MGLYKGTEPISLNGANGRDGRNGADGLSGGAAAVHYYNIALNTEVGGQGGELPNGLAVNGQCNTVGGERSECSGGANICYGYDNTCAGTQGNSVFGYGNELTGASQGNHVEGMWNNLDAAQGTHLEGYQNEAHGSQGTHVEGYQNKLTSGSIGVHVEGKENSIAGLGMGSHVGGYLNGYQDGVENPLTIINQGCTLTGKGHSYCLISHDGGYQGGVSLGQYADKPPVSPNKIGSTNDLIEVIGGEGAQSRDGKAIRTMDAWGNVGIAGDLVFNYNGNFYSLGDILAAVIASGITITPIQ